MNINVKLMGVGYPKNINKSSILAKKICWFLLIGSQKNNHISKILSKVGGGYPKILNKSKIQPRV